MSRNDWHEAKMGTCVCGRWAKVLDDICAECHDAEQQYKKEAAYLKRIRQLESSLKWLLWLHNDDLHGTTPVASETEWDEAWETAAELVKEPPR